MPLKHLINPKPSILIFFLVFCVIINSTPILVNVENINNLYSSIGLSKYLVFLLSILIPFFIGNGLNNMIYEKNVLKKESVVISFVYVALTAPFFKSIHLGIASLLILFLFSSMIDGYQKEQPFSQYFNSSFILGVLILFLPNLIFLLMLLYINGINYSNLNLRSILITILGLIIPYTFYCMYLFLFDKEIIIPFDFDTSILEVQNLTLTLYQKSWLIILFVISLFSFMELFIWLYKKSIKSRKTFMTIIWFFIITIFISFAFDYRYIYIAMMPLTIILSNFFVYTNSRLIANASFLLLLISSLFYKFMIGYNV
tara:strand:+ start:8616 stop:9557 length:942 start_codon:yes stop_codon:yes gene_type:complete